VSGYARVFDSAQVYGDAQVFDNAQVFEKARVSVNAWVFNNAQVSGNARVSGGARISGDSRVSGGAHVSGDARVGATSDWLSIGPVGSRDDVWTAYRTVDGIECSTGCFIGSLDKFRDCVLAIYPDGHLHRVSYLAAIQLVTQVFAERRKHAD
jgi:tetrahydrodipicolinate N-succinyltransferase